MIKVILFILFSVSSLAQNKVSLNVTKYGLSLTNTNNENGIQLTIPEHSTFYCFGEKVILGIVELDNKKSCCI